MESASQAARPKRPSFWMRHASTPQRYVRGFRAWLLGPYAAWRVALVLVALLALAVGASAGPDERTTYRYSSMIGAAPLDMPSVPGVEAEVFVSSRGGPASFSIRDGSGPFDVTFASGSSQALVVCVEDLRNVDRADVRWVKPDGRTALLLDDGRVRTDFDGMPPRCMPFLRSGAYRLDVDLSDGSSVRATIGAYAYIVQDEQLDFPRVQATAGFGLGGLAVAGVVGVEWLTRRRA